MDDDGIGFRYNINDFIIFILRVSRFNTYFNRYEIIIIRIYLNVVVAFSSIFDISKRNTFTIDSPTVTLYTAYPKFSHNQLGRVLNWFFWLFVNNENGTEESIVIH